MNNDTCTKKKIQEMMEEYKVENDTNKHAYIQAAVNVMFKQIHEKKGIKMFGERAIEAMIKELKK